MTFEEIEERMNELDRKLAETHDKKIIKELYELALDLEKRRSREQNVRRGTSTRQMLKPHWTS
jgi:hypothetical protein